MWILELARVVKFTGSMLLIIFLNGRLKYSYFLDDVVDFKYWMRRLLRWARHYSPVIMVGILFYAKDAEKLVFNKLHYPHKKDQGKQIYLLKIAVEKSIYYVLMVC
jgi:hypothetical protein